MQVYGVDAIVRIISHFAFIYLAFWSLRSLRIDQLFRAFHTTQVRMAIAFLSIVIGYGVSSFVLELIGLARNLFLSGIG